MSDRFEGSSAGLHGVMATNWWLRVAYSKLSGTNTLIMAEAGDFPGAASFYHAKVLSAWAACLNAQYTDSPGRFIPCVRPALSSLRY
ncbi:MAG: hypothetical protein NVSMB6_08470 [Burkholderiaceae bacterium]